MLSTHIAQRSHGSAPCCAIAIEVDALHIKLGSLLIVTYPWYGFVALARYDICREFAEYQGVLLQFKPLTRA